MASDSDEAGQGHPLPASDEARTDTLPEHLLREKGKGDDGAGAARPAADAVARDGARRRLTIAPGAEPFARSWVCYASDTTNRRYDHGEEILWRRE